jgi:hypothetical protein
VLRLILIAAMLAMLAACAGQPVRAPDSDLPKLRLSPASLGVEMALQQRLQVIVGDKSQTLEALLEVDASELRLGVQALGQSALTMRWDGKDLQQRRADWLPPALSADRVLFDLQLVFWPADAIRAVLPVDWSLQETPGRRVLLKAGVEVVSVDHLAADHSVLKHLREAYVLDVTSTAAAGSAR